MAIKSKKNILPWAEDVLQGIAYWIGHRRALYRRHYLTEGTIVAELANLMGAHLYDVDRGRQYLYCEIAYRNIAKRDTAWNGERVDLLLAKGSVGATEQPNHNFSSSATCAIEVKLVRSGKKLIEADLVRLAAVAKANRKLKTYLVVVGENQLPRKFVAITKGKDGMLRVGAKLGATKISGEALIECAVVV
jgi:hypothetical protein